MIRPCYAGATGLRGHPLRVGSAGLDVANVGTLPFEPARSPFGDLSALLLRHAGRPTGVGAGIDASRTDRPLPARPIVQPTAQPTAIPSHAAASTLRDDSMPPGTMAAVESRRRPAR
jgi:flagellar hook protein FlgE